MSILEEQKKKEEAARLERAERERIAHEKTAPVETVEVEPVDPNDTTFFPNGQVDKSKTLKQLAEESQIEVFQTYLSLLRDPDTPAATKLNAANALADRGLGKPEQSVNQKVEIRRPEMDIHDAARAAAFAIRKAREDGMVIDINPEIVDTVESSSE